MDGWLYLSGNKSVSGWGSNLFRLQCRWLQWTDWKPVQQYCKIDVKIGDGGVNTGEGVVGFSVVIVLFNFSIQ